MRRLSVGCDCAGTHVVLGDLKLEAAKAAGKIFEDAGFETSAIAVDKPHPQAEPVRPMKSATLRNF